jgi:Type II intron maturase
MNSIGLSLSTKNLVVYNVAEGFTFLGAMCKRVRETSIMFMDVDSYKIYRELVKDNLARFSNHSSIIPQGTAKNLIINLPHAEIVKIYSFKVRELINYYSFVSSRQTLKRII